MDIRYPSLVRFAAASLLVSILAAASPSWADRPGVTVSPESGRAVLVNGRLKLTIETASGLNPCRLQDTKTGRTYADSDYVWPGGGLPAMSGKPVVKESAGGEVSVTFAAGSGGLAIEQTFTVRPRVPDAIFETISIRNTGSKIAENVCFVSGFAKRIKAGDNWTRDAESIHFCSVPYRRDTDGVVRDLPLRRVAEQPGAYTGWMEPLYQTPAWGADSWVWSDGSSSLLIAKYNPNQMEWGLLTPVKRGPDTVLAFGGAGVWKHGSPQGALKLAPGKSFTFGETMLRVVDGDWKSAYYAYRDYSESKGCKLHRAYNPPVHWNELYENDYFFVTGPHTFEPDFPEKNVQWSKELYTLDMMKAQAAKAKELGCEALYLDPGWETGFSRSIWGEDRLGSEKSFLDMMKRDYGLKVSVWAAVAGAPPTPADILVYPKEALVMNAEGQRTKVLCVPSPAFQKAKKARLATLARPGLAFLMFDSSQYTGPCYDPTHGHSVPSTHEEHVAAILSLIDATKRANPRALIELHDPVTGPSAVHYTPTYFGYTRPYSFDCLWAHEFMWSSLDDLLSGRALSLYYYNLAYSIPLYLHIGLKNDNVNALAFWWYASTCRHLGVGGQNPDPAIWAAHKAAMRTYLAYKPYYTQGSFYGLDETIHAHTLRARGTSVMNVFNLTDQPATRTITFKPGDIGLPNGRVHIEGAEARQSGDEVSIQLQVPAKGQALVIARIGK